MERKKIKIGDLFFIEKGSLQSSKATAGSYTFITAANEWKTNEFFTHDCEALIFAAAASGSLGRVHHFSGKFVASDLCFILTPKKAKEYPLNLQFYHFVFNSLRENLVRQLKTGTSKESINKTNLSNFFIPYFDIVEQKIWSKKIKNIDPLQKALLTSLDEQLISINHLRQAILLDAIQGKLLPHQLSDEPTDVLLKRIKEEKQRLINTGQLKKEKPLNEIQHVPFELPDSWKWCRLGNITIINSGVTLGKLYKEKLVKVPYLRVANVQRGWISVDSIKEISVPKAEIAKYQLRKGDLLMIEGGDWDKVGRCAIWDNEMEPFIHQNHIYCIRAISDIANEYLEQYLNSPIARRYFESCSKQTTNLASINKTQLSNTLIPLPPKEEQRSIVSKVKQLMSFCDDLESKIFQSKIESGKLIKAVIHEAFVAKGVLQNSVVKTDKLFWQKQLLSVYINMLVDQHQEQGEMAVAKYAYLNDRIFNAGSDFHYIQHNFGPYSMEIKNCLASADQLFYKQAVGRKGYEVYNINKRVGVSYMDSENPYLAQAKSNFQTLIQVFSKYPMQERARQLELVASLSWLIEQHQTTDIEILYKGMQGWQTPKRNVMNKGELFTKSEVFVGLKLIKKQGWDLKLLTKI